MIVLSPPPTSEQRAVLGAVFRPTYGRSSIVVHALAGTGKTTCLLQVAAAAQGPVLYLAFNRCAQREAAQKFGSLAVCRTFHALALEQMRQLGPVWQQKLANLLPETLDCVRRAGGGGGVVAEELSAFCWSGRPESSLSETARRVWDVLKNPLRPSVPLSHELYLKLWCLSFSCLEGYRCVLLDEAQDANPAVLSVLQQRQEEGGQVVLVGDPNQALYRFQGTADFLAEWSGTSTVFQLTTCFRCGPEVVRVANERLGALGSGRFLRPAEFSSDVVVRGGREAGLQHMAQERGLWAVLCRTNALVAEFIRLARKKGWAVADLRQAVSFSSSCGEVPSLVVGTVHAAKGLEFDQVYVAMWGHLVEEGGDSAGMIAYVACTRAKRRLFLETGGDKRRKKNVSSRKKSKWRRRW